MRPYKYKPRRQSRRWLDADCPAHVLAIYDNPAFVDRFTVFYCDASNIESDDRGVTHIGYRDMSENPLHPQGVGLYGVLPAHQVADYRYRVRRLAARWSSLPEAVKRCVRADGPEAEGD